MILSCVGELLDHFGSSIAIFLSHMRNMIASVHVHIERDVCVPQPFLLISMVGYRTEWGGCSAALNHSSKSRDLQPGRHTHKGKKSSVRKGGTCPVLPCCRKASLPSPPPLKQEGAGDRSTEEVAPPLKWVSAQCSHLQSGFLLQGPFPLLQSLTGVKPPPWAAAASLLHSCTSVSGGTAVEGVWGVVIQRWIAAREKVSEKAATEQKGESL